MATPLNVSNELRAKLAAVGDRPILDSEMITLQGTDAKAEKVLGTQGWYISSPADDWTLRGPFA